jgi:hypothetical protein
VCGLGKIGKNKWVKMSKSALSLQLGLIRLRQRLRRDKLGLFGFVFFASAEANIFIMLCYT